MLGCNNFLGGAFLVLSLGFTAGATGGAGLVGVNNFFTYTFLPSCFTCVRPLESLNTLRPFAFTFSVFTTGLLAGVTGAVGRGGVNSFFTYIFLSSGFT